MLKYLMKFSMDILPSVAATIIGAYIVNHYINAKPAADAPVASAVSTADPKADAKSENKSDAKPVRAEVANIPAAGIKARGISEKAILEKTAAERPSVAEKPQEKSQEKPGEPKPSDSKSVDAPAETASIPAEPRRNQPAPRDKVRVVLPSPVQAAAPAVATPNAAPPAEAAGAPEERRDASDLARAAIQRLRSNDNAPRPQEAARTQDAPRASDVARIPDAPRVVTAPSLQPLPPPVMVSTPPAEMLEKKPPYGVSARNEDAFRPTPPAEIPIVRAPLDLHADASGPSTREHTSVAEDVLSAAKSMFHAVLPK